LSETRPATSAGPGPFITRRVWHHPGREPSVWLSRAHRKSLRAARADRIEAIARRTFSGLADAHGVNWWIATLFAVGSALFAWASLRTLISVPDPLNGVMFFAGSVFFTAAAGLQFHQAARVGPPTPDGGVSTEKRDLFGWRPGDIGWLSCFTQFLGTLLFNLNTFEAMRGGLDPGRQDLLVWSPDFVGSALFLISGQLAFSETCHAWWRWIPDSLSWWITAINLAGCVAFMVSAFLSWVPLDGGSGYVTASLVFTGIGAVCFLVGALLLYPESADA
jgi:hypothetical protein